MTIDWEKSSGAAGQASTQTLLLAGKGADIESALESVSSESPSESVFDGRNSLEKLKKRLSELPQQKGGDEGPLPANVLLDFASRAIVKITNDGLAAQLTIGEHAGTEAVILTDGTRPSLRVSKGFVDVNADDVGDWGVHLRMVEAAVRKVTGAVGRIDVPASPFALGTCFVIGEGLALTNRHVLEEIATLASGRWTLKWPENTRIDFDAETDDSFGGGAFKVVDIVFAGPDAINRTINFAHLDAALLRFAPVGGAEMPSPLFFDEEQATPEKDRDFYVVGCPGKPRLWRYDGRPPAGYEAADVLTNLFGDTFGVKRLSPGQITAGPGALPDDANGWVCSHDASTLGGSSGSVLVYFQSGEPKVVGLHFGGMNRELNWAHTSRKLHDQLKGAAVYV